MERLFITQDFRGGSIKVKFHAWRIIGAALQVTTTLQQRLLVHGLVASVAHGIKRAVAIAVTPMLDLRSAD